ncbi:MAG: seryl-tRNA synthetase [Parcubacteria group bacterium Gr01-1014_18]|nr:MAG: seryl-tRNA synthetase [Parcubacteria group bacterium Greene0416_36]TSC81510.1 MAG: seryl-tRNA synthetase [Parcubacteria group bacterium Gr01-1014_18]TSC99679.1 MAG: seryl-tRNA synthetase [Parcubacteria group bacterium Greene1014_20]TSD07130.1 MAG: seryl-tRNA synthetase [Parcubacteria group bacterium Greene0714_2]
MLDIKFIKQNVDLVRKTIQDKRTNVDLDALLALEAERGKIMLELDALRARKNNANKEIVQADPEAKKKILEDMKHVSDQISLLEETFKSVDAKFAEQMWRVPLPPYSGAIIGTEADNKVLYKKGEIPQFDFTPKDHMELAKDLDLVDFEAGVKLMGNRGYFLKNQAAVLEFALISYALEFLRNKGYTQFSVPVLAQERFFYGTGHLPFGGDEIWKANDKHNDFGLIGTAEIALCGYFADQVVEEKDLPIRTMAFSPCFRTEVGSYGKDAKGLYRVKQFYKVEQVVLCKNDVDFALKMFEEVLANAEEFLQSLELPYQVLELATGDMGPGKYKMYDIETYMPSRAKYGETHSCSLLLDWQARRSNIKFKNGEGKREYVYMLNNTLVASPRILIPILELNQQKDGSIKIPKVLQKYCGFDKITKK